jgi:hypothetical protein
VEGDPIRQSEKAQLDAFKFGSQRGRDPSAPPVLDADGMDEWGFVDPDVPDSSPERIKRRSPRHARMRLSAPPAVSDIEEASEPESACLDAPPPFSRDREHTQKAAAALESDEEGDISLTESLRRTIAAGRMYDTDNESVGEPGVFSDTESNASSAANRGMINESGEIDSREIDSRDDVSRRHEHADAQIPMPPTPRPGFRSLPKPAIHRRAQSVPVSPVWIPSLSVLDWRARIDQRGSGANLDMLVSTMQLPTPSVSRSGTIHRRVQSTSAINATATATEEPHQEHATQVTPPTSSQNKPLPPLPVLQERGPRGLRERLRAWTHRRGTQGPVRAETSRTPDADHTGTHGARVSTNNPTPVLAANLTQHHTEVESGTTGITWNVPDTGVPAHRPRHQKARSTGSVLKHFRL